MKSGAPNDEELEALERVLMAHPDGPAIIKAGLSAAKDAAAITRILGADPKIGYMAVSKMLSATAGSLNDLMNDPGMRASAGLRPGDDAIAILDKAAAICMSLSALGVYEEGKDGGR